MAVIWNKQSSGTKVQILTCNNCVIYALKYSASLAVWSFRVFIELRHILASHSLQTCRRSSVTIRNGRPYILIAVPSCDRDLDPHRLFKTGSRAQAASSSLGSRDAFPSSKTTDESSSQLTSFWCRDQQRVDVHLRSTVRLITVVLTQLGTGKFYLHHITEGNSWKENMFNSWW
jgi:hypothetical protein